MRFICTFTHVDSANCTLIPPPGMLIITGERNQIQGDSITPLAVGLIVSLNTLKTNFTVKNVVLIHAE